MEKENIKKIVGCVVSVGGSNRDCLDMVCVWQTYAP